MNELLTIVKQFMNSNPPDITKDQFFLIDLSIIERLIDAVNINPKDRVLEVGAGLGFLTDKLAKKAKEVLAFEIDTRFKPYLEKLPQNVTVVYGDAYRMLNDKSLLETVEPPTKTVSSIPYSRAQNMLHNYTNYTWYQGDLVWLAPLSLAKKVNTEPILGAYFKASVIQKVERSSFFPQPNTNSAIIYFKRLEDPIKTDNFEIYFRRWLYNHEHVKVKNALREGIIYAAADLKGKTITKNQSRELITGLNIPSEELEKLTNNIKPDYYFKIPEALSSWYKSI